MTTATMPRTVKMRPVASADDSLAAGELLALALGEDLAAFDELTPGDVTYNPVEIAEDESAALFEVYAGTEWGAHTGDPPIARIVVRR